MEQRPAQVGESGETVGSNVISTALGCYSQESGTGLSKSSPQVAVFVSSLVLSQ